MPSGRRSRYRDFKDDLDLDSLYEALGFEVQETRGGNDIGRCILPYGMHKNGDTTGKFAIHRDKAAYNCFVCGGGTLLSLAMEMRDLECSEAEDWLRQFAVGDTRSDAEFSNYLLELMADTQVRIETMPYFNERVLDRFEPMPEYFLGRGISLEVQEAARLCGGEMVMRPAPRKNGEKIDDDYFGPAAIFPHFWKGRLVGWQSRWLDFGVDTPRWLGKYTNSSDMPKVTTLYAYDEVLRSGDDRPVIVVESIPTALFLRSHGYDAVATFGSNSEPQLRLLRRFQRGVILTQDNDGEGKAGQHFLRSATDYLERYIPVWHLPPVPGEKGADLNDFAREEDPGSILKIFLDEATTPSLL